MKELGLHFGALAPKLNVQLAEQGFEDKRIRGHERIIESIIRLHLNGYIPSSRVDRMYKKLFKDIKKHLKPLAHDNPSLLEVQP